MVIMFLMGKTQAKTQTKFTGITITLLSSCFQQFVLKYCHYGDPRFSIPPEHRHCLDERTNELGQLYRSKIVLLLKCFMNSLTYETLTESEFVNLLGDFGGQLGFWCGISSFTCCEFFSILQKEKKKKFFHFAKQLICPRSTVISCRIK
uniref:Uncharacterized protein n=1 Tax=Onchocerca volvulus TaxID=6282 RepID=A0A8R1TU51_ONCVO